MQPERLSLPLLLFKNIPQWENSQPQGATKWAGVASMALSEIQQRNQQPLAWASTPVPESLCPLQLIQRTQRTLAGWGLSPPSGWGRKGCAWDLKVQEALRAGLFTTNIISPSICHTFYSELICCCMQCAILRRGCLLGTWPAGSPSPSCL